MSAPSLDLEPITWPAGDAYHDPQVFRAAERFWWHDTVATELRRLRDDCTHPSQPEHGIAAAPLALLADNLKMNIYDLAASCRQMITWGELVKAEPLWDHAPSTWVALAPEITSSSMKDQP